MKKKVLLFIIMIGLCFIGTSLVKAEEEQIIIFTSDQTTAKVNVETGEVVGPTTKNLAVGATMTFEAKKCTINDSQADQTTKQVTISKSTCQDVTATYTSSDSTILTVENNVGTVKKHGTVTVTATVAGDTPTSVTAQYYLSSESDSGGSSDSGTAIWKHLFVVDKNMKTVYYDSKTADMPTIKKTLYVGNKEQFFAYICSTDKATVSGTKATWNISNCEKPTKVTWEKDTMSGAAFSIDQNGVVTALKSGFGYGTIYAKVNKTDVTLKENEYFNEAHNNVEILVENAKYNGNSNNDTTDDGKPVKIGDTASNTSIILVVTSVLMIGFGAYLIVTSRKGQVDKKNN